MESSNINAMLVAASEFATESRWRETIDMAGRVVAIAPSQYEAWWLLAQAYEQLRRETEAVHAYAEYYRQAPKRPELRATREFAARRANIAFEEADATATEDESEYPLEQFLATIDGKKVFVQVRNDSGKSLGDVIDAAERLIQSTNPFDAWVHAQRHPELFTAVADTVLSTMAKAQADVRARTGVERYRDALRRVRRGEGVLPFAEMANIGKEDFQAFVSAVDDIQPMLQKLFEAGTDAERASILKEQPQLVTDDRTLTYLRLLGGLQRDPSARNELQRLFTLIRRARRGNFAAEPPAPSAREQRATEQAEAALAHADLAAIDAALAEWDAIALEHAATDPSSIALSSGTLRLARYELTADPADLHIACDTFAAAIRTDTDPDLPLLPYQYGSALLRRFEREGNSADLDLGIASMRHVLTLVVDGTRVEGATRSLLGSMLLRRGESTGNPADFDDAIAALNLAITADAQPAQLAGRLGNLAISYLARFDTSGSVADLDEAERHCQDALELAPSNPTLSITLGRIYRARYDITGKDAWLDRAIDAYHTAIAGLDVSLDLALAHNNLSTSLRDRYQARGDVADIDAAIESSGQAVDVIPVGHVQRPLFLQNLANSLRVRATRMGNVDDVHAAMTVFEEVMACAPEGSSVWRAAPANLGGLLEDQEHSDRSLELLELGFARCRDGAAPTEVVEVARALALAHGHRSQWSRAGDVLLAGIEAIERLQRVQLSTTAKRSWLEQTSELHIFAADMLLRARRIGDALAAIERGRGRLLAEALGRDRTALAKLESLGDQRLVERYRTAAEQVRVLTAAADRGRDVREPLLAAMHSLDAAVQEVRQATGGAAFSSPPTVQDIVAASEAANAPLVYLVPLSAFGVAIIVSHATLSVHPLAMSSLTIDNVNEIVERYVTAYHDFIEQTDLDGDAWERWQATLDQTVRWCWDSCMRDVVAALTDVRDAVLIPVGRLGRLPLHAARGAEGDALAERTWRYAPSARSLVQLGPIEADSLLTVVFAAEEAPLPFTEIELAGVRRAFPIERALIGDAARVGAVADEARDATVLHFACHASAPGDESALAGGLQLSDGVLSLQDLVELRLAKGTIAVLSACETGVIGDKLPDEVLTLASGLLHSGASAVVSSLWAVPDVSTAILMSRFYYLWRSEGLQPAAALRAAQRWMRDADNGTLAAFLRANLPVDVVNRIADALERNASAATFGHCVHWAAFTYTGR
jgi:CHAT domain-containing protein/tetratricopeptide (TPR) repeat protein